MSYMSCVFQLEMCNEGDIVPKDQLVDPSTTGSLSRFFRKFTSFLVRPITNITITTAQDMNAHDDDDDDDDDDVFIVMPVLKDKAAQVMDLLSQTHWTSSSIVTITKFRQLCGGVTDEASATLTYLSAQGKARHFSLNKTPHIIQVT